MGIANNEYNYFNYLLLEVSWHAIRKYTTTLITYWDC